VAVVGQSSLPRRISEFVGVALFALALIWLIALVTYEPTDPVWFFTTNATHPPVNFVGRVGAFLAELSFQLFGYGAYLIPASLSIGGWHYFWCQQPDAIYTKVCGGVMLFSCSSAFLSLALGSTEHAGKTFDAGGSVGAALDTGVVVPAWALPLSVSYFTLAAFTFTPLLLFEGYGFCKVGEGGDYVTSGIIDLGGKRPTNTSGGHLCEGYTHGMNMVIENVRQLRHAVDDSCPDGEHTYDYSNDEPVIFAGLPFWKSSNFGPTNNTPRPGGDGERTRQMLSRAGYKLPAERMSVRLVHLVDESRRKELMVIYAEDLAPSGYTAAQLRDGNEPRPEWKAVEQGLVERAMSRIKLSPKPFK